MKGAEDVRNMSPACDLTLAWSLVAYVGDTHLGRVSNALDGRTRIPKDLIGEN